MAPPLSVLDLVTRQLPPQLSILAGALLGRLA